MILWEEHNGIGIITMDAPDKNALSVEDMQAFIDTIESHKESMQGLIVTGRNQSFCSGLSLKDNQLSVAIPLLDKLLLTLCGLDVPVVCAISGHAIGAGFLIMCCADMVYSVDSDRAKYGLPEVKLNICIDDTMLKVLRERLNQKQLKHLLLTGDYVMQTKLLEWGVLNFVCESNDKMIVQSCEYIESTFQCREAYASTKKLLRRD